MIKLFEWLFIFFLIMGPWTAVVTNFVRNEFTKKYFTVIFCTPFVLVGVFGVVSLLIIAYRVFTFNDCIEAEKELKQQIKMAKADLTKKGLKL
ncbi:UNVERIFIED_CONTAM: hypothetical protein RMT77_011664 [Armadillidium vulgare]